MNLVAFEMSTRQGSLAIFSGLQKVAGAVWNDEGARSQTLFEVLPRALEAAGLQVEEIGAYVVGRGPGSYTGLRVALVAAQALALPGKAKVHALNSGVPLAAQIFEQHTEFQRVVVCGDARRERLWMGVFERDKMGQGVEWALIPVAELAGQASPATCVASSDGHRLAAVGALVREAGGAWMEAFPEADWLGRAALERMESGADFEPLTPIYMHPPVFIAPQYPVQEL